MEPGKRTLTSGEAIELIEEILCQQRDQAMQEPAGRRGLERPQVPER